MRKIYALLLLATALTVKAQVTVNGGPTLTYTSLNSAFAAINAGTHFGAITIDITGNTVEGPVGYAPTPLLASGQSSANYTSILIRPTVQATISGAPATGRGVLELDGADNVTIDGDIASGPIQRDLTIQHAGSPTLAATAVVRLIGRTTGGLGATFNTITNCVIIGNTEGNDGISGSTVTNSHGIYAGTNAVALTAGSTGDNYDNNTFTNNEINKAYIGIWIGGTTNLADNNLIANNIIGSNTAGQTISFVGVSLSGVVTTTITQNQIFNLKVTTSVSNAGIRIAGTTSNSVTISRNQIYGIHSLSTGGWGAYGVDLIGGTNHLVVNNAIYDIRTVNYSSTSTTWNAFGIRITAGTGHRIYYNSVNLFGDLTGATFTAAGSAALVITSTAVTGLDIRNNIFNNIQTSSPPVVTTKKFMAVWFPASYNFANAVLDNNAYNVTNDADHFVGKVGVTNNVNEASNIAAWKAFSQVNNITNDVNSGPLFNAPAPFVSNTNLNIPANTNYVAESGAVLIPALGTNIDINGNVRPLSGINPNTAPDMGAYEFDGLNGTPDDAGISAIVNPAPLACYGANETVVATIKNYGVNSISNIPVTVLVSGPVNQTLTGTYTGTIASNGTFNFTLSPTINMSAAGVYSFTAYTSLPGDTQALNDTLANQTRTVVAPAPLPQSVSFTGFTGANLPTVFPGWFEAQGATVPSGTVSNWINQANLNSPGNVNARVYISGVSNNEWIVGPKVLATASTNISFDVAVTANVSAPFNPATMGSDDRLRVMVSTNCGQSYTPIFTVSVSNSLTTSFTNFNVNLSAYAGQEIIVAFLATDGPVNDALLYYLHLDNINLYNASATDAGVNMFTAPAAGCYGNNEPVVVNLNNFGMAPISNVPVTVLVSGAVSQTLNSVFTGTLTPSASANFTVGNLNMTTAGTYSFKAFPTLVGDLNTFNDTSVITRNVLPLFTLPQFVNFTGFTGANLPSVAPGWGEAVGATVPSGTTSIWTSQTGLNATGNITARINLFTTTRNEWILGPKVLATPGSFLSFDAAVTDWNSITAPDVMGSDDRVRVMISTDCGASYTPIFTLSAANNLGVSFTNFSIPLGAYAGQEIIIGFLAQDGPVDDLEDYDFHLDNINIYNAAAQDGGVTAILSPTANACLSNNEPIVVTVHNFGFNPITNFPVTAFISGPVNSTVTSNFTGTLAPNTSASFTIGTANMNPSGTYTINALTSVSGDPNAFNDQTSATRTQLPNFAISGNNFICSSGSTTLNAIGNAVTYTWSTSSNSSSIVVSPSVTTTYSALGTGTNNCVVSAIFTVTVINPTITGIGASACGSNPTGTLTANAFAPVSWYTSLTSTVVAGTGNTYTITSPVTTTMYAEAVSSSNGSLQTLFSGGNGCSGGNMFDVTATNGAITIDSIDVNTAVAINSTLSVLIFYKTGGYLGNETTPAAWIPWDTIVAVSAGAGQPTKVVFNNPLPIPANALHALYVNYNAQYTNGTNAYSNTDVTVQMGAGLCSQFGGVNPGRMFNGNIYYTKPGCSSPKIPVVFTVSPNPTVSVSSSTNTICEGNSVILTASGVDTYTWSTSSNSSTISVTPSVSTTYSVTGFSSACNSFDTKTISITVNQNPTVSIVPSTTAICSANGSISLSGSPAGGVFSGAAVTGSLLSIANPGTFTPMYSYTNTLTGCSNSATVTVIVSNCTGIDNAAAFVENIKVYPNPNTGSFIVESGIGGNKQVELMDLSGRVVYSEQHAQEKIMIDIQHLSNGVYSLKIKSDERTVIMRVIKQ